MDIQESKDLTEKLLDKTNKQRQSSQLPKESNFELNIACLSYSNQLSHLNSSIQNEKNENVEITSSKLKSLSSNIRSSSPITSKVQIDCKNDQNIEEDDQIQFEIINKHHTSSQNGLDNHELNNRKSDACLTDTNSNHSIKRFKTENLYYGIRNHQNDVPSIEETNQNRSLINLNDQSSHNLFNISNQSTHQYNQSVTNHNLSQKDKNTSKDIIISTIKNETNHNLYQTTPQIIKRNQEINIPQPNPSQNNKSISEINKSTLVMNKSISEDTKQQNTDEQASEPLKNKIGKDLDIGLSNQITYKKQIKQYLNVIHHCETMVQIRKRYRKKIFMSLVIATFFQFFVDTFLSSIESVVGQFMYQSYQTSYSDLNQNVTLYYAIFNIAFFPLLSGFIIDQIYCSFVMRICIIVMSFGRIISLISIFLSSVQIRIIGQFLYLFGDSGFYLTTIYTIYFYYYDPANPRKFVHKIMKYLGIGCSLPRNLSGIPMIFVYTSSSQLFEVVQDSDSCESYCSYYMPLLFGYPYKFVTYSLITCLVFITVYFAFRAHKLDRIAHQQMSLKNQNYLENPLFKADLSDIKENIWNLKYFGVILAGGVIYGLTSSNFIYNVNKNLYDKINTDQGQQPDLTLFVIVSGHELVYIMFIWSFGKIIMKDFSKKYTIWRYSGWSCLIYFLIHLCILGMLSSSIRDEIASSSFKYLIYIFLFIINIFSGISFSTNVLCVDSILAKIIKKECIGLGYAFMIVFKKFFEFLGGLSLYYYNQNFGLPYITICLCILALMFILWIK